MTLLASLPAEHQPSLRLDIQTALQQDGRKVVVLDDDPTGTQTVHGIPVLTTWEVPALVAEMASDLPAFYILTNSRSMPQDAAIALNHEIAQNLSAAAHQTGREFVVISRSDSTLRGHYPAECDALAAALPTAFDATLMIPFFIEGGRYTINDIHYVAEGDMLIPAANTPFAQDAVFGYSHSDLRAWVTEKTANRVDADDVISISLADIRQGGVEAVSQKLQALQKNAVCIVNAASYVDLEVVVLAILQAEATGKRFLYRTAASFVQVRAGITPAPLLTQADLVSSSEQGGLIVVGSYVPKTTAQLQKLLKRDDVQSVELDTPAILNPERRTDAITSAVLRVTQKLRQGQTVALYTSRNLITSDTSRDHNLDIGNAISGALVEIVKAIDTPPRYLIAKGGITSSDIATKALNVQRAMVMGQVLPGIPVWQLGAESAHPGMAYIIFPGNVGNYDALADVVQILEGA